MDRDENVVVNREKRSNWSWLSLLLLPVAFFLGWLANDNIAGTTTQNGFEPGVGGAPGSQEERVRPTVTPSDPPVVDEDEDMPSVTPIPTVDDAQDTDENMME